MANVTVRKANEARPAPLTTVSEKRWDPSRTEGYLFEADVPGVKETDLTVTLTGNRLSISGKRDAEKQEQTDSYHRYERSYGDFARSFTLPRGVDANGVHADLKDGVLTISIKKTPETQPKKITVNTTEKKS